MSELTTYQIHHEAEQHELEAKRPIDAATAWFKEHPGETEVRVAWHGTGWKWRSLRFCLHEGEVLLDHVASKLHKEAGRKAEAERRARAQEEFQRMEAKRLTALSPEQRDLLERYTQAKELASKVEGRAMDLSYAVDRTHTLVHSGHPPPPEEVERIARDLLELVMLLPKLRELTLEAMPMSAAPTRGVGR